MECMYDLMYQSTFMQSKFFSFKLFTFISEVLFSLTLKSF